MPHTPFHREASHLNRRSRQTQTSVHSGISRALKRAAAGLVLMLVGLWLPLSVVQAGWIDTMKDIYGLPDQFQQLQKHYTETQEALEQNRRKLEETLQKSEEAARLYAQTEQKLLEENARLKEQNERLESMLNGMERERADASRKARQWMTAGLTAVGLVLLYFILARILRIVVWRRS